MLPFWAKMPVLGSVTALARVMSKTDVLKLKPLMPEVRRPISFCVETAAGMIW